jgi:hypothetical protein
MHFHTTVKLGPNREITPAGFTLFKNVSIARTGEMIYGPRETEIEPGPDGQVYITRSPEEVFRPETLASFNGAPFTVNHPVDDVNLSNWQALANGFFANVRRGDGEQKNEMVGDLLVTTARALAKIDSGSGEVSAGYDCEYEVTGPGRGEQFNIIGNHIALVDEGRCGSRCAIKDRIRRVEDAMTPTQKFIAAAKILRDRARGHDGSGKRVRISDGMSENEFEGSVHSQSDEGAVCTCSRSGEPAEDEELTAEEKEAERKRKAAVADSSRLTPTGRFIAASKALRARDHGLVTLQAPTTDELSRMTPTQRFIAQANFRNARR